MHSRVNCYMNGDAPALRGELAGIRFVHHRLGQPPANEQIRLGGRRIAENQNGSPNSGTAQGNALLQRGDSKGSHTAAAQRAGTGDGSMSVGIRFDHRHQSAVYAGFSLEQKGVGAQGTQINFTPRAASFRGPARQEKDSAQRDRRAEQQHGKKMSQTVTHQNGFQSQHFRTSAHQYNAPGVYDIKHSGETAGVPVLSAVPAQKQGKQKQGAERQKQIHAVMALRFGCPQKKGFHAHRRKGKQESHKTETRVPALRVGSEQKKEGGEKNAVSGVSGKRKQDIVERFAERQGGDKAIIAVSSQADQVEEPRRCQAKRGPFRLSRNARREPSKTAGKYQR